VRFGARIAALALGLVVMSMAGSGCGYLAILAGAAAANNGQSGGTSVVTTSGGDTAAEIVEVPHGAGGPVQTVRVRLSDKFARPLAVGLEHRAAAAGSFARATLTAVRRADGTPVRVDAAGFTTTDALDTSEVGVDYDLEWTFAGDLGGAGAQAGVDLQLVVESDAGIQGGVAFSLEDQRIGNDPPEAAEVTLDVGGEGAVVRFRARDSTGDPIRVNALFRIDGGTASALTEVTAADLVGISTTATLGDAVAFAWRVAEEPSLAGIRGSLTVEIVPVDDGPLAGLAVTSNAVVIANNAAAEARILATPARAHSGTASILFAMDDFEGDPADVAVRWELVLGSLPGGVTSGAATSAAGDDVTALETDGRAHAFAWAYANDLGGNAPRRVRLVVTPSGAGGAAGATPAFTVGNDAPVIEIARPFAAAAGGDVMVAFTLADASQDPAGLVLEMRAGAASTFTAAALAGAATGLATGLPGAPASHAVIWRSGVDLPSVSGLAVTLRLRALDGLTDGLGAPDEVSTAVTNVGGGGGGNPDPPTIARVTPSGGRPEGGARVTIAGGGFVAGVTTATVGGVALTDVVVSSASALTGTVPAGAAGAATVAVTTPFGTASVPGGFTYQDGPVIGAISPAEGPRTGGTLVTITGAGFGAGADARTGGAALDGLVRLDDGTLRGTTRPGPAGAADVSVTTPEGTAFRLEGFRYLAAPVVGAVTPASGPTSAGTAVSITGSGFLASAVTVTVDGAPLAARVVVSDGLITATLPAHAAGAVTVAVTTAGGTSSAGVFTYRAAPTIASVAPERVVAAGGTTITVAGAGFVAGATDVSVGGALVAGVFVANAGSLSFDAPAGSGVRDVVVRTTGGAATRTAALTYVQPLAVASVAPAQGNTGGGQAVTIVGAGFDGGALTATLGGAPLGALTLVSPSVFTGTAPAGAAGSVALEVTTTLGATVTVPSAFAYTTAPVIATVAPLEGALAGGTDVAISGSGFAGGAVTVGGLGLDALVVTSTLITGRTRAHAAGPVEVRVTTASGAAALPSGFRYLAPPVIQAVAPGAGPTTGGTAVLLSGAGFLASAVTVTVGGAQVAATVLDDGRIALTTPARAAGAAAVSVETPGGTTTTAAGFTYLDLPTITTVSPGLVTATGGALITVGGSGFVAGATEVRIGGGAFFGASVADAASLTFTAPPGAGTVALEVRTASGAATRAAAFTYVQPLSVASVTPATSSVGGGQEVAVVGAGFDGGALSISIDGAPLGSLAVVSPTLALGIAPAHAVGTVTLSATTALGGTVSLPGAFSYTEAPVIGAITPSEGPLAGGTPIAISGSGLAGAAVSVGGDGLDSLVVGSTLITGRTRARAAGAVEVRASTASGIASAPDGFRFLAAPVLSDVAPDEGPTSGGTAVLLSGSGFLANAVTVTVGGAPVVAAVLDDARITITTPAGIAGGASIAVTTPGGSTVTAAGFTYRAAPTITSVSPQLAVVNALATLEVTGSGFVTGATEVLLGGAPGSLVDVTSPTRLTFSRPAGSGVVDLVVRTSGGTATRAAAFRHVLPLEVLSIAPDRGSAEGGEVVTILGAGFDGGSVTASLGGVPLGALTLVSPSVLTGTAPLGAVGAVDLAVTTDLGGTFTLVNAFTYAQGPVVTSVTPPEGPAAGGTTIAIAGSGLAGATVALGGDPLTDLVVTPTLITGRTSAHPAALVDLVITTSGGGATAERAFRFLGAPILTSLDPVAGPVTGGTAVELTGSGFLAASLAVLVDGAPVAATALGDGRVAIVMPAHGAGPVGIFVSTAGGTTSTAAGFTYFDAPAITAVTPERVPAGGLTPVTISGAGFAPGATEVLLGGNFQFPVHVVDAATITLTASFGFGAVDVEVRTPGGSALAKEGLRFVSPLQFSSMAPNSGPAAGGAVIAIQGTGFDGGALHATLGGVTLTSVTVASAYLVVATTPALPAGPAALEITTSLETVTVPAAFTALEAPRITSISPVEAPVLATPDIRITGTGFTGASVAIGGNPLEDLVVTPTLITGRLTLVAIGVLPVQVTTPGGVAVAPEGFRFVGAPFISNVTPRVGPLGGGTALFIDGSGFLATSVTVTVGPTPTAAVVLSDNRIAVTTTAGPAGKVDVTVTTLGGTATATEAFEYLAAPTITSITPLSSPDIGGDLVTISGTGFIHSATEVSFGGIVVSHLTTTETQIEVFSPARPAGDYQVRVVTAGGTATATYTYTDTGGGGTGGLSVTLVAPGSGPASGGTPITIIGTGFDPLSTVTIGGAPLLDVVVLGPTAIFGRTPGGFQGPVAVVVLAPGQTDAELSPGFTYLGVSASFAQGGRTFLERDAGFNEALAAYGGQVELSVVLSTGGAPLQSALTLEVRVGAASTATFFPSLSQDVAAIGPTGAFVSFPRTVTFPVGSVDGAVIAVASFAPLVDADAENEEVAILELAEADPPSGAVIAFAPFASVEFAIIDDDVHVTSFELPNSLGRSFLGEQLSLVYAVNGPGSTQIINPGGLDATTELSEVTPFPTGVTPPALVSHGVVYSLAARAGTMAGERFELTAANGYGAPPGDAAQYERTEVAALPRGESVIAMRFQSTFVLDPGGAPRQIVHEAGRAAGVHDLLVARIGDDRRPIWTKVIVNRDAVDADASSAAPISLRSLIVAPDGDIVLVGTGFALLDFGGGVEVESATVLGFVARLDGATGDARWARKYGMSTRDDPDLARSGAVLADGSTVVGGQFNGSSRFRVYNANGSEDTAFQLTPISDASDDGYLARFDRDGRPAWVRRVSGPVSTTASVRQRVFAVAALPDGGFAAAGAFEKEARFDVGLPSAVTLTARPDLGEDALFVTRHRSDGTVVWARKIDTFEEYLTDVSNPSPDPIRLAATPDGGVVISADTAFGVAFPDGSTSDEGVFLARYDADGAIDWRTGFKDPTGGFGFGFVVEDLDALADGSLVLAGLVRGANSSNPPSGRLTFAPGLAEEVTLGPASPFRFLARYRDDGGFAWATKVAPTLSLDNARATVAPRADGSFVYGGRFESQAAMITIGAGDAGAATLSPVNPSGTAVGFTGPNVLFATYGPRSYKQQLIRPQGLGFAVQSGTMDGGRIESVDVAAFPDGSSVVAGIVIDQVSFGIGPDREFLNVGSEPYPYIARYEPDGRLRWALDGSPGILIHAVTGRPDGATVVVGTFDGNRSIGGLTLTAANKQDFFAAAFSASGTALWVVQGGEGRTVEAPDTDLYDSRANDVVALADGRVVVAGFVAGASTGGNPGSITFSGGGAPIVTTSPGPFALVIRMDGTQDGFRQGVGVDASAWVVAALGNGLPTKSGATVLAGTVGASGVTFDTTTISRTGTLDDAFVARFADGDLVWARKIDGTGELDVTGAVLLPSGETIVTGSFTGIVTFGPLFDRTASGRDIFVVRYGTDGAILRTEVFGGTGDERGARLARSGAGTLVLAATFTSDFGFGAGPNAAQVTIAPGAAVDAFFARFQDDLTPLWARRVGDDTSSGASLKFATSPSIALTPDGTILFAGTFNADTVLFSGEPAEKSLEDPDLDDPDPFLFLIKHYGYAAEDP